jgi:hypothetical protein
LLGFEASLSESAVYQALRRGSVNAERLIVTNASVSSRAIKGVRTGYVASLLQSGCPGLSEITDWTPFKMKHELRERHGVVVSRELAGNPTAFDDLGKISFQHDLMRSAVLHVLGAPPVHRWNYGDSLPNH